MTDSITLLIAAVPLMGVVMVLYLFSGDDLDD
jgi:hypothetical protein